MQQTGRTNGRANHRGRHRQEWIGPADQQVYTAISRCRFCVRCVCACRARARVCVCVCERQRKIVYWFAKATIYFYFFVFIQVGDCDGRNNAIISELRRQNKNGKTPTSLEIQCFYSVKSIN